MVTVNCNRHRSEAIGERISDNGFTYRLDFDWAKWPEGLSGAHTLNACFDGEGRLYVAVENPENPVCVFDTKGNFLRSFGKGCFAKAHSVFLTPGGTALVADTGKNEHVIREITLEGELVRTFGTRGIPGNSGYDPDYLDVLKARGEKPGISLWNKSEASNARLDSIRKLGSPFCKPTAMIMNERGEYIASDGYGNCAVHVFGADGALIRSFGGPGNEPGHFRLVHDVRLDCRGRLWVSDRENCRVQVFTQEGGLLAVIGGNLMRIGACWVDEKYAYIGELDGGITILDLDFHVLSQLGCPGSVIHAHGITADRKGNLFVLTNKKNKNNILRLVREI